MKQPSTSKSSGLANTFIQTLPTLYVLLAILLLTISSGHASEKRIALVIGNSAYKDSPLINPVKDARLISATLRDLDFSVMEHLDVDQKTMKRAIQDFGDRLNEAGGEATGLFYYAGHGIQLKGENYLIPVNAVIKRESDVGIEAVNASAVLGVLDYARNRMNFVILDACRNNPFARSFRSANRGLARMDAPHGTLIAYATAPGDVAQDGKTDNSPYSDALASAMRQPNLPIEQMFKMVRRKVMAETGNVQVPWESSSLTDNFYFVSANGDTDEQQPAVLPQTEIDKEALFWQSIQNSQSPDDYREYLRQFPEGTFAGLAHKRIDNLAETPAQKVRREETEPNIQQPAKPAVSTDEPVDLDKIEPPGISEEQTALTRNIETEPNNSMGQGNYISSRSVNSGCINPRGDSDWYMFSVKQQGALDVQLTDVARELDLAFRVWNGEHNTISNWHVPLSKGAETTGVVDLAEPGQYCLELRDSRDDAASSQPYQLTLFFQPTNDVYEPNNSFGTAKPINPGTEWQSTILPRGDSDWYRLTFDRQGELDITVRNAPEELDVSLRLWNADKQTLTNWYVPLKAGGDVDAVIDIPQPGSYVMEIRDGRDDARSVASFLTTTTFKPSVDLFEPNNSFGSAAPLAIGETVQATILPRGDSDWYRLSVDEQGELKVAVTDVQENLDISFRLWNGNMQTISSWITPLKVGGETEGTIDLPEQGSYILEVRDGRDDARSVQPYSLQTTYTPTNDRGEPNNSFGKAVPLKLGSPRTAAILPRGDSDWYRVSTDRPGNLKLQIISPPENLDIVVRVWNDEKRTISGWIQPLRAGGETTGEVAIPEAGSYIIEVRDGRDDERSAKPYNLTIEMDKK